MVWLVVLVGGGILSLLLVPVLSAREPWGLDESPDRLRNLKRSRDRVLRTLKDLENDMREGTLAREDYEELRATYKRQAIELTRMLDRVRETVIRQIREGPAGRALTATERQTLEKMIGRRAKKYA